MEQQDYTQRTKIYYDAEFTGLHRNTSLISIGLVSQSGAYFYAEFNDYDESQVDDWLKDNVIANLMYKDQTEYSLIKEFYLKGGVNRHLNMMMKGTSSSIRENLLYWLKWEYEANESMKIQFYTDCYAYDWMVLMDLICDGGKALNLPNFIDYIPADLSTALLIKGFDPDINREEFIGEYTCMDLSSKYPFNEMGDRAKHNSLWDATVALWAWNKVLTPNRNQRIWSAEAVEKIADGDKNSTTFRVSQFEGEMEHPAE